MIANGVAHHASTDTGSGKPNSDNPQSSNLQSCNQPSDSQGDGAPRVEQIISGAYSWHVVRAGQADQVCVLLHGTGASSHSWNALLAPLSQRFSVVSLDLPGHAQTVCSGRADLTLKGIAKSVAQLLKQMKLTPHTIVGHSAGAAIAVQMAVDTPKFCQKIVSINGAMVPLGGLPGLIFPPVARVSASLPLLTSLFSQRLRDPNAINRLLKNTGSRLSPESTKLYHALCNNPSHVNGALQMMASWQLEPLYRQLPTITTPVHLIAAENDAMIPKKDAYRLNGLFQHCELTLLPQLGHLAHEEEPKLVADIILQGDP